MLIIWSRRELGSGWGRWGGRGEESLAYPLTCPPIPPRFPMPQMQPQSEGRAHEIPPPKIGQCLLGCVADRDKKTEIETDFSSLVNNPN